MSGGTPPRVAIILLNYNGRHLTEECLLSLQALDYPGFRAIVIDNGSRQDESIAFRERFGDSIDVIRSEESLGFCGGNNLGMRFALARGYDYLLLLNNDTTVEKDFLTELVALAESEPRIGVAGPKIVYARDHSKLDSIGGDINLWTARHVLYQRPYTRARTDLAFVSGCAFLLRRAVVEQVGMLDEDFYSYWEESDYCLRLRRAGWLIACNPRSVIYHKVGQTNAYLSNRYIYYMVRNGLLCMRKNGHGYQWPTFLLFFAVGVVAKYAAYLLVRRPRDLPVVWRALADFTRGRLGRREVERAPAA